MIQSGDGPAPDEAGSPVSVTAETHVDAIAALLNHRLAHLFPKLHLIHRRFYWKRLRRDDDLVARAFDRRRLPVPPRLAGFHKWAETRLFVRTVEPPGGPAQPVIATQFARRSVLPATDTLLQRGFNVVGLRASAVRDRHRIGLIRACSGGAVSLLTAEGEMEDAAEWEIAPSTEAFAALLAQELSESGMAAHREAEWQETSGGIGWPKTTLRRFSRLLGGSRTKTNETSLRGSLWLLAR